MHPTVCSPRPTPKPPREVAKQPARRVPAADQVGGAGDPADRGVRSRDSLAATRGAASAPLKNEAAPS